MKYAVALDIGGTKIEGILFNDKFKQIKKKRIYFEKKKNQSTVNLPKKEVLKIICNLISELKYDKKINGIGICLPDIVTQEGNITGRSKIKAFSNFNLKSYIKNKFKCKVEIKNDADCFALAEQKFGAGKKYKNVIGIIAGTGIGAGIIIDGKIYSGTTGSAGEFGHNTINPVGPVCRCGLKGCVEAYASGPNIVRNYIKAGGKIKNPDPHKLFKSKEKIAKKIMSEAIDGLAKGLAQLMNILNPKIIVIGGGLSNLPIYSSLNKLTKKYTRTGIKQNVNIVRNKIGDSAGVYGAAALILE